jgi:hypothetical protein
LKYYFKDKMPNKSKKRREDLVVLVQLELNERNMERDETGNNEGIQAVTTASVEVEQTGV